VVGTILVVTAKRNGRRTGFEKKMLNLVRESLKYISK